MEEGRSWTWEIRGSESALRLRHVRKGGDVRNLEPFGRVRYDFTYGALEGETHEVAKSIYARVPGGPRLYYFDAFVFATWFDPPLPLLPEEPRVGREWTWEGRAEFRASDDRIPTVARLRVTAREEIGVPAGVFRTIRVEQVHEEPPVRITRWFAPGVGLVREEQVLERVDGAPESRTFVLVAYSAPPP
jgi:hypothetical protein